VSSGWLEQLRDSRGLPRQIRVDNGPEFISAKLVAWCEEHEVKLHHIQPGKPTQNAYIERFNRSFRHEVLQAHLFGSLEEVREHAWDWLVRYNEERPHAALGNLPPSRFREQQTKIKSLIDGEAYNRKWQGEPSKARAHQRGALCLV
jgi:putative transposase